MPFTTPPNFVAGAVLTEAQLDILSDNETFLANPPKVRVFNSAAISVATGVLTPLTFNSERFDTDTMHSTATFTERITFTTAGTYSFFANVEFAANATGFRQVTVRLNGTTFIANQQAPSIGAVTMGLAVAGVYAFSAADYIEVVVQQNSGGALNVNAAGNYSPEAGAVWVSL